MSTAKPRTGPKSGPKRRRESPTGIAAVEPTAEIIRMLMEANSRAAQAWFDGWTRFLADATEFASRRLGRDLETVNAFCGCKTPVEALEVHTRFVQKAVRDYVRELTRLGDIETDTGVASIEALDRGVREAGTQGLRPAA